MDDDLGFRRFMVLPRSDFDDMVVEIAGLAGGARLVALDSLLVPGELALDFGQRRVDGLVEVRRGFLGVDAQDLQD